MQIQILSTAALMGLGRVLPFGEHIDGNPLSRKFYPEDQSLQLRAQKEVVIDYESGMSLLILHETEPLVFYLDRTLQLAPGTPFSIVPMDESCTARITLQHGDTLEFLENPHEAVNPLPSPQIQISKIYTCFYQEAARDFYFRGERHAPYELTYVDQGSLHNLVNGSDMILSQGEIAIIGRNDWHMQYANEQVRFLTITFDVTGDALERIKSKPLPLPSGAREPLKRFLSEHTNEAEFSYDYLESLLKIVLIELLRASEDRPARSAALPSTTRAENQIVDQALQIISQRIHRPPGLKELAAEVHVSVPYLCRLFDTHLGIPPGQYITKIRLEECKELLRQGELSMNAIASYMGFSSAQHFSRQFKHYLGLTPTEYTRSLR